MIQDMFEQNIFIYVFAGLFGLGLMIRLIVNLVYKHLLKETDNIGATKNKSLKHIKMKFETCYKLRIGVNNVDTFVDKHVYRYRFCGVLLSTWENLCGQVLFLTLLSLPIIIVLGLIFECGQTQLLLTGVVGLSSGGLMILVDKSINLHNKKRVVRLNLLDYFENFCKVRLEQEAFHPELLEQYRKEYFNITEPDKQISATSISDKKIVQKDDQKDELNRRREARRRKEEEKRALELKREEEHRKLEEARKEEEKRRLEERRLIAERRREEERIKLEEERAVLEARRLEAKRKAEEKRIASEKKVQQLDKERILHNLEEELKAVEEKHGMEEMLQGIAEIAAEKDIREENHKAKLKKEGNQEDKLIEDVLKEFFA